MDKQKPETSFRYVYNSQGLLYNDIIYMFGGSFVDFFTMDTNAMAAVTIIRRNNLRIHINN